MATRSRPRTPIARRRLTAKARQPVAPYRRGRATVALMIFLLLFCGLWMINGEFTADYVMQTTGKDATWGWSTHLVITAIEIAPAFLAPYIKELPRRIVVMLWLLSLPFGIFDTLSSAVGVAPYMLWTGAAGNIAHVQNVILAEIIGFLPEQMIMWLIVALRNVVRG